MRYKLPPKNAPGVLKIDGENQSFIPASECNADWREYQTWLAAGNTPEPADTDPAVSKTYTPYEFMNRFTDAEKQAIVLSTDINVRMFVSSLYTTSEVIPDFPATVLGMNYLVSQGLITAERKEAILS